MIYVKELHYRYPNQDKDIIEGLTLKIRDGTKLGVMGKNGSGKTTLIKLLAGLLEPTQGYISINNTFPSKANIGFSPEDPEESFFGKSVREEVEFYPKNLGLDYSRITEEVLKKLDISALKNKMPYNLSSGEQRKISIASILSGDPDILIFDEPTHSLDAKSEDNIGKILKNIDKTVIFTTHSSDFALKYSDDIILLDSGNIIGRDKPNIIFSKFDLLKNAGIRPPGIVFWARKLGLNFIPSSIHEIINIIQGEET